MDPLSGGANISSSFALEKKFAPQESDFVPLISFSVSKKKFSPQESDLSLSVLLFGVTIDLG